MREFARKHEHRPLLRSGPRGHRARAAARAGPGCAGGRRHRRGQPHLHLRRPGRLRHRRRLHRPGRGHGHRRRLVPGARDPSLRVRGRAGPLGHRQGPDSVHHRPDRRRRSALQGDGVRRPGHRRPAHGRALHHVQHGHRGRRQERHHRADEITKAYVEGRLPRQTPLYVFASDEDAAYEGSIAGTADRHPADGGQAAPARNTRRRPNCATSASTRSSSAAAPTAASKTCAWRPASCAGARSTRTCAASSSRHPGHLAAGPSPRACSTCSSRPSAPSRHAHLRALPGRTHGGPGRGRAGRVHHQPQLRRPHGPSAPRSTWPARTWPRPARWPGHIATPDRSAPEGRQP